MKLKKKHVYILLGFIVGIIIWTVFFRTPSYETVITPKPLLGNANAELVIIEFSDLQCPFCKRAHEEAIKPLIQEFGDRIAFSYNHFPLTSAHPMAFKAAEASECANDQGKFWSFVESIYANQEQLSMNELRLIAHNLKLDTDLFNTCLDSGAKAPIVEMEQRLGAGQGVTSTPTFILNKEKIENWKYPIFKAKILEALKEKPENTTEQINLPSSVGNTSVASAKEKTETTVQLQKEKTNEEGINLLAVTR